MPGIIPNSHRWPGVLPTILYCSAQFIITFAYIISENKKKQSNSWEKNLDSFFKEKNFIIFKSTIFQEIIAFGEIKYEIYNVFIIAFAQI